MHPAESSGRKFDGLSDAHSRFGIGQRSKPRLSELRFLMTQTEIVVCDDAMILRRGQHWQSVVANTVVVIGLSWITVWLEFRGE